MTTAALPAHPARTPPTLPGGLVLGSLRALQRDALGLLTEAREKKGDVVRLRLFTRALILVASASGAQRVLVDNVRNYRKESLGYTELRRLLGDGLVTSEGELWKSQRRLMQPAFHRERIAAFAACMGRVARETLTSWATRIESGTPFDLSAEMMQLTWRVVGETLLSVDVGDAASAVGRAMEDLLDVMRVRTMTPLRVPVWLPVAENTRFERGKALLDDVILRIVAERRAHPAEHHDLLAMLMDARDEDTGKAMDDRQLRDELMTLMLAGHETTANALTFALVYLSEHPDIEERLRKEVDDVTGGAAPDFAHLPKLLLAERVIQETLRLRPPVWGLVRRAVADDVVDGFEIPAGTFVIIAPYVTHRHPAYWRAPDRFDPDRFLDDDGVRPKYAYFPFSAGNRKCIGDTFALMEAKLVLATLVQKVHVEVDPAHPIELVPAVTLRPKHGVRVRARAV